ncbi:MAG: hypothetical protein BalsKO_29890 [Balneolaceae bacterium]
MRPILFLSIIVSLVGCKSSHKLTGTDYIDLSKGTEVTGGTQFPIEIAADLDWGNLSSDTLNRVREEFRIALISETEPFHLFRIYTKKRGVTGEAVLFWRKKRAMERTNTHENMKQYLKGKCDTFFETDNFGYCKPIYVIEPNWRKLHSNLEARNIWQISDQSELGLEQLPDSNIWVMTTQVRLGDYYRNYSHSNPEKYPAGDEKINILGILTQLQNTANNEYKPENFNVYSGITNGKKGASFTLCDESEVWRFNASLEELILSSGYPAKVTVQEEQYFYITISGVVEDEWYGNRSTSGFERVINPLEINSLYTVAKKECPAQ